MRFISIISLLLLLVLNSCMKDDVIWDFNQDENFEPGNGVFIINEGNFMSGNASLTYYNIDEKKVIQNVFYNTNNMPLGDVAQSMVIRDSIGYIVLNNSGKIVLINTNSFEFIGKITGLVSPRHIHFISDEKAYVSDLYSKSLQIINPQSLEIVGQINLENHESQFYQHPSEQILQYGKYLLTNAWSFDNKILIIDTETDRLVDSIVVTKQPNSMVLDKHNNLWVLSDGGYEGNPYGNEPACLTKINLTNFSISAEYVLSKDNNPRELAINPSGDSLYYINADVYKVPVTNPLFQEVFIKSESGEYLNGGFYGLGVDPHRGEVYVADAKDNSQNGIIYRFHPSGQIIDSFPGGIVPGAFCFK
jgi:DNA-binding beta-propeller fold protein YncE